MNELLHEIEESMRQEKIQAAWREYGPYIITGCILAILFTACSALWQNHAARQHTAETSMLIQALDSPDAPAALEAAIPHLHGGLRALAYLNEAGVLLQKDQAAAALAVYNKAAADATVPAPFHDMAVTVAVRLDAAVNAKTVDAKMLLARLRPVIDNGHTPWQDEARMQAASIAAHNLHDLDKARGYLQPVLANTARATPALMQRAQALDLVYAAQGGHAPVKEPK